MSRRPKYCEQDFPPSGTIFAAPTSDGRFSAGRILRREFHGGAQGALIAASPWLGEELPPLKLPVLRETLHLSHHKWKNDPRVFWVHDPMPRDFIIVGQIEPSPNDLAASSDTFAGWQSVPIHALLQWRWDHDREALLRDEVQHAAEQGGQPDWRIGRILKSKVLSGHDLTVDGCSRRAHALHRHENCGPISAACLACRFRHLALDAAANSARALRSDRRCPALGHSAFADALVASERTVD